MKSSYDKERGFCCIDKPYIINLGIFIGNEPKHFIASISLFYKDLIILLSKTFYEEINSIVKVVEHELIVPLLTISFYNHKRCMSMLLELVYANTSG